MSRAVPSNLKAAVLASHMPDSVLSFLDIYHATVGHIYLVNNPVAITRQNGNTYQPFPFAITLPTDKDGQIGDARLTIDAIDLSIITAIRSLPANSRATVSITVALGSATNTADEVSFGTFEWKNITYNQTTVSGDLTYEDRLDIMVPILTFTPVNTPGVF